MTTKKNLTETVTVEKAKMSKITEEQVNNAKSAFDKYNEELTKKVYLVSGGIKTADHLIEFIEKRAKWQAHESLGVVKINDDLLTAKKENKKELYLSGLCIEAIAYFLSKAEGTGLEEARKFKEQVFEPINDVMLKVNEDKRKLENLQREWGKLAQALEQGVDVEG